jgi:hypothetical protein
VIETLFTFCIWLFIGCVIAAAGLSANFGLPQVMLLRPWGLSFGAQVGMGMVVLTLGPVYLSWTTVKE